MPTYRVKTDQGEYNVTLDQEPASREELQGLVETHLAGGATPSAAAPAPTGEPGATNVSLQPWEPGALPPVPAGTKTPIQSVLGGIKEKIGSIPPVFEGTPGATSVGPKDLASLLPSSETGLLAMLGTGGAAGVAAKVGMRTVPAALFRIFGGAVGGGTGAAVAGESPISGALTGGVGAALGEVVAPVGGFIARTRAGAKARITGGQAAETGQAVESANAAFAGARTPEELARMAKEFPQAKAHLSNNFEANIMWAEQRLSQVAKQTVPPTPDVAGPTSKYMRSGALDWDKLKVPALSDQPITLREASELLKNPGQAGFGGTKVDKVTRTVVAKSPRETVEEALGQIQAELGRIDPSGQTYAIWNTGRQDYTIGMTLLPLLRNNALYTQTPQGLMFNRPALQEQLFKRWGPISERLPTQDLQALQEVAGWGPRNWGAKDIPAPGSGRSMDASMRLFRGANTGSMQALRVPLATILPNIGAQYAGRTPYTASPVVQTIADLVGIGALRGFQGND